MKIELPHPPIKKPMAVKLTRKWSDWSKGDIIVTDSEKAKRMIAKGYGDEYKPSKQPEAETATAPPPTENTMANPELKDKPQPKRGRPKKDKERGGAD